MRTLAPLDSAAYSELVDLCRIDAARPRSSFKPNGSFIREAVQQAQSIIDGFAHIRGATRLGRAWLEGWSMGPKWRKALREGSLRLSTTHLPILAAAVTEAAVMDGIAPSFDADADPRASLVTPRGRLGRSARALRLWAARSQRNPHSPTGTRKAPRALSFR